VAQCRITKAGHSEYSPVSHNEAWSLRVSQCVNEVWSLRVAKYLIMKPGPSESSPMNGNKTWSLSV
jgi:hypothetical protein